MIAAIMCMWWWSSTFFGLSPLGKKAGRQARQVASSRCADAAAMSNAPGPFRPTACTLLSPSAERTAGFAEGCHLAWPTGLNETQQPRT